MTDQWNEAIRMMRALVKDAPGADIDIDDVNLRDRSFLLVTCSAQMIAFTLANTAGKNKTSALKGLDELVSDIKEQIAKICDGHDR